MPVIRNVDSLTLAGVEKAIADMGAKAKAGPLPLEDMAGGTFTISNGGVFGSLMGTPIINPPQSAILGMHATNDRPVAINGEVGGKRQGRLGVVLSVLTSLSFYRWYRLLSDP